MKKTILGITVIAALATIVIIIAKQLKLLKGICFNVIRTTIDKVGFGGVYVTLNMEIKNPSKLVMELNKYVFNIYANSKLVAKLQDLNYNKTLKPEGRTEIALKVIINPSSIFGNVITADFLRGIASKNDIDILIKGYVSANSSGIGVKDYPVEIKNKLSNMVMEKSNPC